MTESERRQDARHKENTDAIGRLDRKLDPLVSSVHSLCGDGQHPGRMGAAERKIEGIESLLGSLDKKMAVWGGVMAAALIVIEVAARWLGK